MATRQQQASDGEATKQIAALRAEIASLREELAAVRQDVARGRVFMWNYLYENAPEPAARHEAYFNRKMAFDKAVKLEQEGQDATSR